MHRPAGKKRENQDIFKSKGSVLESDCGDPSIDIADILDFKFWVHDVRPEILHRKLEMLLLKAGTLWGRPQSPRRSR